MRKIISKIAGALLGLSLAVGVGIFIPSVKASQANAGQATWTASAQGYSNGEAVSSAVIDTNVSISFTDGGNATAYYNTGSSVRIYKDGTFTVSSTNATLTSIVLSYTFDGTATISCSDASNWNADTKTWTGSRSSVTWTAGTAKHVRLASVQVTYTGGSAPVQRTVSYYSDDVLFTSQQVVTGNATTPPSYPEKSGYCFAGWFTDNGTFEDPFNFASTISADISLYAKWSLESELGNVYTINLTEKSLANGTTYMQSQETVYYNGGACFANLTWNKINPNSGQLAGNKSTQSNLQAHGDYNFSIRNTTAMPRPIRSIVINGLAGTYDSDKVVATVGSSEITTQTEAGSVVSTDGDGSVSWAFSGTEKYFGIGSLSGFTSGNVTATSIIVTLDTPVDPGKKNMVIKQSGNEADGGSFYYSSTAGIYAFKAYEDSTELDGLNWSVSDETVATINPSTGNLTCVKPGDVTVYASKDGYNQASASIHIIKGALEEVVVSGSMSKTTYYTGQSWSNAGLTATAVYHSGWEDDVTSTAQWSYEPSSPALNVESVTATATFDEVAGESEAQSVTVLQAHAGTSADPFSVAEGINKCVENGTTAAGDWYVKGIVSAITSGESDVTSYGNVTFNMSDNGENENFLIAFQVKYINGASWTLDQFAQLQVGCEVVVHGALLNYKGNTPEFDGKGASSLVSMKAPETGDIKVTFSPAVTSYEVGANGTFTATSDTAGASIAWSTNKNGIITINSETGAFEAVAPGVVRVTATATLNDKSGFAFADITINGSSSSPYTVEGANEIASGVASGQTTAYYIYVKGYVKEFATSKDSSSNPRALDITNLAENSSIMVYTNVSPYSGFISGLSLGDYIVVKANVQNFSGTFELTSPEKISSSASAMSFAINFISQTDEACEDYVDGQDRSSELAAIWDDLGDAFDALSEAEAAHLINSTGCGATINGALARYDYLVKRYKSLDRFITGRVISGAVQGLVPNQTNNSNSLTAVIVIVALASISSLGILFVLRRKYWVSK